eukprot:1865616-Rhodomonas_salina.2
MLPSVYARATLCPVLTKHMLLQGVGDKGVVVGSSSSLKVSAYAHTVLSPVLTWLRPLPPMPALRHPRY